MGSVAPSLEGSGIGFFQICQAHHDFELLEAHQGFPEKCILVGFSGLPSLFVESYPGHLGPDDGALHGHIHAPAPRQRKGSCLIRCIEGHTDG